MRSGYGVFELQDGSKYEGEWLNGNMHGSGVFTDHHGSVLKGRFENNKFIG